MTSLVIRGARIIDPANQRDLEADLYIADGRIAAIGGPEMAADHVIDAAGLILCPGLIDLGARLPEPGFEQKGTVLSETKAAVAGGVTSLCCTPDTLPVMDSPSVAGLIQDLARQQGLAKVWPLGALTKGLQGQQLSEMHYLKQAGCIALTNLRHPFQHNRVLLHCLEYAASLDIPVFFSPVDQTLAENGCVHNGRLSMLYGLAGISHSAETVALSRDLLLVEQTGVRAHFGSLSCARSVELIAAAKQRGLPVTADVAMHHLIFTEIAVEGFDSLFHVQPPLRTEADRDALLHGLLDGTLDAIRSDHQPHETAAKMAPFPATEPGISALETLLPLGLSLVDDERLSLQELVRALTLGPASVAGLPLGTLSVGVPADVCIFDPRQEWVLDETSMYSRGHNTPLLNTSLTGRVVYTLVDGRCVYQAPGWSY